MRRERASAHNFRLAGVYARAKFSLVRVVRKKKKGKERRKRKILSQRGRRGKFPEKRFSLLRNVSFFPTFILASLTTNQRRTTLRKRKGLSLFPAATDHVQTGRRVIRTGKGEGRAEVGGKKGIIVCEGGRL